ncbi:MAG: methyltransferase domain-containing protein [Ignavibacteriae bacterium]|nr:methyltransferase domain-containing protein [Ignavibacteriota bacterium]
MLSSIAKNISKRIIEKILSLKILRAKNLFLIKIIKNRSQSVYSKHCDSNYITIRPLELAREYAENLKSENGFTGKRFLDFGCGESNPLGTAAVLYINGAGEIVSTDIKKIDDEHIAYSLYELLIEVYLNPSKYYLSLTEKRLFTERLGEFSMKHLREGDLSSGLGKAKISFRKMNPGSEMPVGKKYDIIASVSVLEHVQGLEEYLKWFGRILDEEGVMYHHIDLVDHRAYTRPGKYNYWTFLTIENYKDTVSNMLRHEEIAKLVRENGFEITQETKMTNEVPDSIYNSLSGSYNKFSKEEISITGTKALMKKIKGAV